MEKWFRYLIKSRFIRFCITGGLNTLVDFAVFWVLTVPLQASPYLSQILSYSAGMLNSYCINRSWTFGSKNRFFGSEMLRFLLVNLCVLGVSVGAIYLLAQRLPMLAAKLFTTGITMILGFVLNRLVVFR